MDIATDQLLYQFVDVPADVTAASFWVNHQGGSAANVNSPPLSGRDFFRASLYDVTLGNELVRMWEFDPLLDCPQPPPFYNLTPSELVIVRGRTVALVFEFRKVTSTGWQAAVIIDDVQLHLCSPSPPCQVSGNKTAQPSTVPTNSEVTVTISLTGYGSGCDASRHTPDLMLVLDRSGSMKGQSIRDLRAAAKAMVDRFDMSTDQIGLVSFNEQAVLDLPLSGRAGSVRTAIDRITDYGDTNIADAIDIAVAEVTGARRRTGNVPVLVVMSDGVPTAGRDPRLAAAAAKAAGIRIFTVGLGDKIDPNMLREIASSREDYFFAPSSLDLDTIYQQIAGVIGGAPATNVVIVDRLSPDVTLVPASFGGLPRPSVSPDGRTLTWRIPRLGLETRVLTYRVRMGSSPGTFPVNTSASATYTNSHGQPGSVSFPVPQVTVTEPQCHPPCGAAELVCRDHTRDQGVVPSNRNGEAWWDSPDIWVRQERDGQAEPQNPVTGQTNYVYAHVTNRGTATATDITVHFYNTPGAANLRWPADWVPEIGVATLQSLGPGQSADVSVPWLPPEEGHFCFLVRIESPDDPIQQDGWVPFDNNICQRNVQILSGGSCECPVGVGNHSTGARYGGVIIRGRNVPSGGSVIVQFEDGKQFDRWQEAGGTVQGGQIVRGSSSIRLEIKPDRTGAPKGQLNAVIDRIPFASEETGQLTVQVRGGPGISTHLGVDAPTIEITQLEDGQPVGGNIIRPPLLPEPAYLPGLLRDALFPASVLLGSAPPRAWDELRRLLGFAW